jgi:acetoin utilization deacetylase AcuC-like enzyme
VDVGLVLDDVFLGHAPLAHHPERPERLIAVRRSLTAHHLVHAGVVVQPRPAREEEIGRVHTAAYLADLTRLVPGQSGWLDEDTSYSPGTWTATLAAAGAAIELAEATVSGRLVRGMAVIRPPGHHALRDRPMGFCLLNNVAIAAAAARAAGLARVAIVDWDVHHGNGTQDIFWEDPSVLFISLHQFPYYPGSGASEEIGGGPGKGATVNLPLPAGSGDAEYCAAVNEVVVPALKAFRPELILCSAGFDAYVDDPLAGMNVTGAGFALIARAVRRAADELCGGRMVCLLEGGYDLLGVSEGVLATYETLIQTTAAGGVPLVRPIHSDARQNIEATKRALAPYYPGVWP